MQWSYKNYKPKDTIKSELFPAAATKLPENVNKFLDWFLAV